MAKTPNSNSEPVVGVIAGSTIECASAELIAKRLSPSSVVDLKNVGLCKTYRGDRNSWATILKELDPKDSIHRAFALLNKGDKIQGESMVAYVKGASTIKREVIDHSGRHNAQRVITRTYTYAILTEPFPNLGTLSDPKQIALKERYIKLEEEERRQLEETGRALQGIKPSPDEPDATGP